MAAVFNRITRPAMQAVTSQVIDGVLLGRAEYLIIKRDGVNGPQWWRVVFAPLASAWDGKETSSSGSSIQVCDTWARVRFGDGLTAAAYVSWPALGGCLWLFGTSVEVSAFPSLTTLDVAAVGPSWGVAVDDEPLDTGNRASWLGLGMNVSVAQSSNISVSIPPYARAVNVLAEDAGLVNIEQQQFNAGGIVKTSESVLTNVSNDNGSRLLLDPRSSTFKLFNPNAVGGTRNFFLNWEIAP